MKKKIKISIFVIFFVTLVVLSPKLKSMILSNKAVCVEAVPVIPKNLTHFFKTRLYGYEILQSEIAELKEEIKDLNLLLKASTLEK